MKSYLIKFCDQKELQAKAYSYFKTVHGESFCGASVVVYNSSFSDHRNCKTAKSAAAAAAQYIKSSGSAFATINQFSDFGTGRLRRSSKSLYGISALVIDLDKIDKTCGTMSRSEMLGFLKNEAHHSKLPKPNFVVETGSGGYHLYYLIERLPAAMEKSVQALKLALYERYVHLEDGHDAGEFTFNLRVDLQCTDVSRVIRVPGSFHEGSLNQAEMISVQKKRYSYRELADKLLPPSWNYDYLVANLNRSIANLRSPKAQTFPKPKPRLRTPEALAERRIQELFRLADSGYGFSGCRELACFLIWNNAVVLHWDESVVTQVLNDLNGKFYAPLPEKELFRCAKTKKHYKMTNEKFVRC